MRRENRRAMNKEGVDLKKGIYISGSILAVVIIVFAITFFIYGNSVEQDTSLSKFNTSIVDDYVQNTEEASSSFGKTVNEMSNEVTNEVIVENANEIDNNNTVKYAVNTSKVEENESTSTNEVQSTSSKTSQTKENTTAENNTSEEEQKVEDPKFIKPVEGEIIREFAKDKLVYSNTLGEWVTHNGIDIKADKTTVVKSSAEGTVKSIKNDPRYGLTVVIEHVNGFTSVYSNLLTAEFVVEGEQVKQSQTIGTVGNTATFEISDEAHLHFEIAKDGEALNPELYLKD